MEAGRVRRWRQTVLCLALGLAVGACGGGDRPGPAASLSPAATSAPLASTPPAGAAGAAAATAPTAPAPAPDVTVPAIDPSRIVINPGGLPSPPNMPEPPVPLPVPPNLPNLPFPNLVR